MTDYCLNDSNSSVCARGLEILDNVLWRRCGAISSTVYFPGRHRPGSLLTSFVRNLMLPRLTSLNSNNLQHTMTLCPMLLDRILVFVDQLSLWVITLNFRKLLFVPNWAWAILTMSPSLPSPPFSPGLSLSVKLPREPDLVAVIPEWGESKARGPWLDLTFTKCFFQTRTASMLSCRQKPDMR